MDIEKKTFKDIETIVSKEKMLSLLIFDVTFYVHTYIRGYHIGGVL